MKKYVTPNAVVVLLESEDICTASNISYSNAKFDGYDFGEDAWI